MSEELKVSGPFSARNRWLKKLMARAIRIEKLAIVVLAIALVLVGTPTRGGSSESETFFLVATPDLPDPLFAESVILMIPRTPPPLVVGLIVNKPTDKRLGELFPNSPALKNRADAAYFGGPVDIDEPALVFRSASAPENAMPLFDGIYVSVSPKRVANLLKDGSVKDLRLYFGRSQWSREQLHDEMLRGSWYVVPADPAFVFSANPEHVWRTLVEHAQTQKAAAFGRR